MGPKLDEVSERLRRMYLEALPQLLEKCQGGLKHAIIGLDGVQETLWDTYEDALQIAYEKYGLQRFHVMPIRPSFVTESFTRDIRPVSYHPV